MKVNENRQALELLAQPARPLTPTFEGGNWTVEDEEGMLTTIQSVRAAEERRNSNWKHIQILIGGF